MNPRVVIGIVKDWSTTTSTVTTLSNSGPKSHSSTVVSKLLIGEYEHIFVTSFPSVVMPMNLRRQGCGAPIPGKPWTLPVEGIAQPTYRRSKAKYLTFEFG